MPRLTPPIPQDKIGENFVWRDWFQRLSDKVFGTLATQDSHNVTITGGSISGINFNGIALTNSTVDNSPIGSDIPSTGNFTSLSLSNPLAVVYGGTGVNSAHINYVFAGPASGSAGAPTFRALVANDIPSLAYAPQTTGTSILYGNGSGGFSNVTIGSGVSFVGGTLSATGTGGTITSVTATTPLASSGGTTPNLTIQQSSSSQSGYLSSTDWSTFNGKQAAGTYVTSLTVTGANGFAGSFTSGATPALTVSTSITGLLFGNGTAIAAATISAPLNYSAGTLSITQSTTSTNGYLSSTDWNTFNNKQAVSAPVTKTADFTVASTDLWLINNKSGSTCTVTLPTASTSTGRVLHIQNYQAQTVVSAASNVVAIAGGSAATAILNAVAGDTCTLVSDGTNWITTQYTPNNILLLE